MINVVYAFEPLFPTDHSIFLAGPTPRANTTTPSWRPAMLDHLTVLGFDGVVFVPEAADWKWRSDPDGQIDGEWAALERAAVILFWISRDLLQMPAFTTNVEFGYYVRSGKCLLGYPPGAPKMGYLARLAKRHDVPIFHTMADIATFAVRVRV